MYKTDIQVFFSYRNNTCLTCVLLKKNWNVLKSTENKIKIIVSYHPELTTYVFNIFLSRSFSMQVGIHFNTWGGRYGMYSLVSSVFHLDSVA